MFKIILKIVIISFICTTCFGWQIFSKFSNAEIKTMITNFKKDERGPYQSIRWFCPDGTIIPPKERCPQPGGIQHALHKNEVTKLADDKNIFLGQILAGTKFEDFWDAENDHSRLKQYMLEQYLQNIDDGWILRRARFYRGAIQAEDEADWGYRFLSWLLAQDQILQQEYFLVRMAFRMIPHNSEDKLWDRIRAVSKVLSDSIPSFTDLRVKLHGRPEENDLQQVVQFRNKNNLKIKPEFLQQFDQLEKDLSLAFEPIDITFFEKYQKEIPENSSMGRKLKLYIDKRKRNRDWNSEALKETVDLLWECRIAIDELDKAPSRLAVFDLSIALETFLFRYLNTWKPENLLEYFNKCNMLVRAASACGFLEKWEYENIKDIISIDKNIKELPLLSFQQKVEYIQRSVEWASGMVRATFKETVDLYTGIEPLASGYIDDRIRISMLLAFGTTAGELVDLFAIKIGRRNEIFNIASQNQIRGLNPGFARGELKVIKNLTEEIEFDADKIYALAQPPSDLKPVAGILTISEGNLVSHVQLLARNLGIPNAVITNANIIELEKFSGKEVFYAVSPRESVILKEASSMTRTEQDLFKKNVMLEEKFTVPTEKINLNLKYPINLRELRNKDSGVLTGPKAANLGELKYHFNDHVVEGFALPFGLYHIHMEQPMPGQSGSYWHFLKETFHLADTKRINGSPEKEIEQYVLDRLTILRQAISKIQLMPKFQREIEQAFINIFDKPMGTVPVFIRSDTNMEDLKDFTGAGLNLTVFNVRDTEKIWQGIRDVWASPFSERSYRWRQRLLFNPEDVYPSILIIPSVNVEKSGVVITSGVFSGSTEDITVAFNRGVGGAVEGQIAESYTIKTNGKNMLLSPSREKRFMSLPAEGGIKKQIASFDKPVLESYDLKQLSVFARNLKNRLSGKQGFEISGILDVELGFKDEIIWLFQVRPFVENKNARSSAYLNNLDPVLDSKQMVDLENLL